MSDLIIIYQTFTQCPNFGIKHHMRMMRGQTPLLPLSVNANHLPPAFKGSDSPFVLLKICRIWPHAGSKKLMLSCACNCRQKTRSAPTMYITELPYFMFGCVIQCISIMKAHPLKLFYDKNEYSVMYTMCIHAHNQYDTYFINKMLQSLTKSSFWIYNLVYHFQRFGLQQVYIPSESQGAVLIVCILGSN